MHESLIPFATLFGLAAFLLAIAALWFVSLRRREFEWDQERGKQYDESRRDDQRQLIELVASLSSPLLNYLVEQWRTPPAMPASCRCNSDK